jgi:galactose mutarotase-like enzyme
LKEVVIENDRLRVVVLPELGGKISSIRSGQSEREWLWRNPHLSRVPAGDGDSYIARHDTGGVDECVPTVDACVLGEHTGPWSGIALPDHGEIYGRHWKRLEETDTRSLTLETRGINLPYRFQRKVSLGDGEAELRIHYEAENLSRSKLPFNWCIHPIFNISPGMKLLLPDASPVRVASCSDGAPVVEGEVFSWPTSEGGTNIAIIPDPVNLSYSSKMYAGPLETGRAGLIAGDEQIEFRFDTKKVPFVALWLNYGAWTGADTPCYFNLAVEPSIGDADSLDESVSRDTARWLEPGDTFDWELNICLQKAH